MKNYEKPIVLMCEDMAEGVYAASGVAEGADAAGAAEVDYENDPTCWSLSITPDQVVAHEGWATFRVQANHPGTVTHISSKSVVTVVFSRTITNVEFEGFDAKANGATVVLTRETHGNSYYSGDQYNTLLKVWCDDPASLSIVSSTITCTHATNVQGGFD